MTWHGCYFKDSLKKNSKKMTFFPKWNFVFMIACKCTSTSVNSPTYRSLLLIGYLFDLENKFLCGVLRDCDIPIALITTVS